MDVGQQEAEAKARAAKHVANMLQRPDQLEKVEQYKRRVSRKKAAVEAMLKTAMQSQLDGVRSGLNLFLTTLIDLQDIKTNISEMESNLKDVPKLAEKLKDVRRENAQHSQYAAAVENLKHIFTVPESVERTQAWIADGKILESHQSLCDLENSRDDLLFELHKLPNQSERDQIMLKSTFADVEKLSDTLGKQLFLMLNRTLNTIRKEPTVIVTAFRIIEREERADQFALLTQRTSGYMPPGRPKQWRKRAFQVMEEAVHERIEGNQFEERKDNKMWLVRHLEVTRLLTLDDLRVIKTVSVPCFPPEYDIFNKYVEMYHNCLSRHLQEIVSSGLEGNEFVSLLTWLGTYEGPDLLGHPELCLDRSQIKPLLDNSTVHNLMSTYLDMMDHNYTDWMSKTLDTEIKDWYRDSQPELDGEGHFHTVVPVIVFQMIDQNLQVARTVSDNMMNSVLLLSMKQVNSFGIMYKDAIVDFKSRYFEDRSKVTLFTHYMIAIINNCLQFAELSLQLKGKWKGSTENSDMKQALDTMIKTFQNLRIDTAGYLLDEIFLDLEPHFQDLLTRKWVTSAVAIDTICCTIEDYCSDYRHLRPKNFDIIIAEAQNKVCKSYITAILLRRMNFKSYEERRHTAEKIIKEAEQMRNLFSRINNATAMFDAACDILISLAEVLKVQDTEFLSLELSGVVRKYPDMTQEHLTALLTFRGDMGRADVKQLVSEIIPERREGQKSGSSLFSEIHLPTGVLQNII